MSSMSDAVAHIAASRGRPLVQKIRVKAACEADAQALWVLLNEEDRRRTVIEWQERKVLEFNG